MKRFFLTLSFVLFVIPIGISQDLPSYVPTDGLLAYYPFNGNANDASGNGNHGTVNGATLTTDRNNNADNAYVFDNSNIEIPHQFYSNGWNDYTINLWFLTSDKTVSSQAILNTIPHDGEGLNFNHPHHINVFSHYKSSDLNIDNWDIWNGNEFSINVENNIWYMISIIKHNDEYKYYINNQLISSSINALSAQNQLTGFTIGSITQENNNQENLLGKLDDIGFWNKALSQEEMKNLYNSSTGDILLNGVVSAENNQIKNVSDPTHAQDAATKSYVDSNINSFSGSYNDLTDKPITYTQSQVDALIEGLQNQINSLHLQTTTEIDFTTYYDLETGDVCDDPFSCDSRFDLRFPYGGGDIKARLWWNESDVDVAYVYDKSFFEIQLSDVSSYYFCEHINDPNQACSDTDSPPTNFIGIYHTSEGNYYAVEYLNENTGSFKVSFRYKLLQ